MIILDYKKQNHKQIIKACVTALKLGKVVAYPTDTSYGLAVDVKNIEAIKKLYRIKDRGLNKPVHVIVPSITFAKKIVSWNKQADKLAKKFLPGPLTLVLELRAKGVGLRKLSAGTGFLGVRMPKNQIALDLVKLLKNPITTTSANPSFHLSGGFDSYSAEDVLKQFTNKKHKPDIVLNAGKLFKHKPSTLVKIDGNKIEILRKGPISEKEIKKIIKMT